MITKEKKREIVVELVEKFKGVNGVYFLDFTGMTVFDAIRIRREFKKIDVTYMVAKNTLIKKAMKEVGELSIPDEKFIGPTGVVFAYDDAIAPAKIIKDENSKQNNIPVLKAALIEGEYFDGAQLKELAAMPGKLDILASIVGSVHAPISGIVGSINAVMRDVAYLVEEVAKKKAS